MFNNRSVVEIMVMVFTFVVAFSIISTGAMIAFIEINDPEADTSDIVRTLFTAINIVLGALLGLLAGKSEGISQLSQRPDKTKDDITGTGPPNENLNQHQDSSDI